MPRKGHTAKRTVPADAVYGSNLVTKFINSMMWQGKRSTAEGIFYEALGKVQEKGGDEALKRCSTRYAFGLFAPYFDLLCLRLATPTESSVPRTT